MRPRHRIAVIGVLVILILGLGVLYGVSYPANWPYPTEEELVQDPDEFAAQEVLLIAEVVDVTGDDLVLELEDSVADETREIVVNDVDQVDVEVGGVVQVHGELDDSAAEIDAVEEIVVVETGRWDALYKWGMSGLGLVVAIGYFLIHWRIDRPAATVVRRGEYHG